jgi:antitoxin ParD1/3/4
LLLANFAIHAISAAIAREPTVPTRNISLTPELDAFINATIESGEYQNASETVRDALRALRQRRREDALKLEALRRQIDAGVDALARGEFTEIADVDLDAYLAGLTARSGREAC